MRKSSREKILAAAAELARCEGSAHLSLEAIAARANVSKGGLLYNFPTKSALMRALVQQFIDEFGEALDRDLAPGDAAALADRYFELVIAELDQIKPPPSGLLAALAEDPSLLEPVRRFNRKLLDRMKEGCRDAGPVLILFLALEGLRSQMAFGTAILHDEERRLVLDQLRAAIGAG